MSAARLGERGRNSRHQGVPRETFGSWDRAFPPISAPARPPRPACSPSGITPVGAAVSAVGAGRGARHRWRGGFRCGAGSSRAGGWVGSRSLALHSTTRAIVASMLRLRHLNLPVGCKSRDRRPVPAGGVQGGEQGTVDAGDHRGSGASASTRERRPSLGWRRSRSLRVAESCLQVVPPRRTHKARGRRSSPGGGAPPRGASDGKKAPRGGQGPAQEAQEKNNNTARGSNLPLVVPRSFPSAEHTRGSTKQPQCRAAARCSGSPRSGSRSSPPPPPPGPAPSTVRPPPAAPPPPAPPPPRARLAAASEGEGRGKDPEEEEEEEPEGAPEGSHGASAPTPSPPFPPPEASARSRRLWAGVPAASCSLPPRSGSGAPAPGAGAGAAATAGPAPVPSHPAPGPLSLGGPEARAARNSTACRGGG